MKKVELDLRLPEAVLSELCRGLRLNAPQAKKIVLTGASAGGESIFAAIGLGAAFGREGKRTLIIDTDAYSSLLEEIAGFSNKPMGLSDVLTEGAAVSQALYLTQIEGVQIMLSGIGSISFETLKKRLPLLLSAAEKHYDYILLSAPPLSEYADAVFFAELCDGAVLLIKDGTTTIKEGQSAVERLKDAGCNILGAVSCKK